MEIPECEEDNNMHGAAALVARLHSAGVQRIFALSGNHVMPVFDAALDAGIEIIHTRHEGAAVHMADAHARLTGSIGVALVTGGPGHANAVGALYTAAMAESPMLLLSGHAPVAQLGLGAFQEMNQVDVAEPLVKASWMNRGAASIDRDVAKAIRLARAGRPGPVHLSLPTDALEAAVENALRDDEPPASPAIDVAPILERLLRAERPLVLCGPVLMTKAGRAKAHALEAASGIPVIGMESPRGIADPSLGAFAEALARADCILLLGKRLDFTLKFGAPPAIDASCAFLQIDPEPEEIDRTERAVDKRLASSALAPAVAAVDALIEAMKGKKPAKSEWHAEVREAIAYRPPAWQSASASASVRLHPVQALHPLQSILDEHPDSVFISDGGEIGQWAQACLDAPNRVINGMAGSIGAALPFAVAARLARRDAPIIAVMGDGTFGFHPAEIDTAVRYDAHFVLVVGNDARWNAEYQIQLREYGRERAKGCELLPTRYDEVAKAFGGYGELVTDARELLPAARRAIASRKPAVLNVMIEGLAAPNIRR
ncbi:MAG: thiamine pyrophosphate-binding protein [Bacillota bacterium]